MKKIIALIAGVSILSYAGEGKTSFLPSYEPYTAASQLVMDFLNNPSNSTEYLHVLVAYMNLHEDSSDEIVLDNKPNEGLKKIWLNGTEISEDSYNTYLNNLIKSPYRAPGFDSIMSYAEIQNLLNSEEPIYIDVYKPPVPASFSFV